MTLLSNIGRLSLSALLTLLTLPPAFARPPAGCRPEAAIRNLLGALARHTRLAIAAHALVIATVRNWRESEGL